MILPVIERAKKACTNSGQAITDHFEDILEMIILGKTAKREVDSLKLSRYPSEYRRCPVNKAKESCETTSEVVPDHFVDVNKMAF